MFILPPCWRTSAHAAYQLRLALERDASRARTPFDPSIRMFGDGPDVRRCGPVPIGLCCRAEGFCSSRMLRLDSGHNKEWDAPGVGAVYIRRRTAPRRQWVIATLVA